MKKLKIKIKEIKSKVKITSINSENSNIKVRPSQQSRHLETIESKVASTNIPLLKKGEIRITQIQETERPPREDIEKDRENSSISYDRFGVSSGEKGIERSYAQFGASSGEKGREYSQESRPDMASINAPGTLNRASESALRQTGEINLVNAGETNLIRPSINSNIKDNVIEDYQLNSKKYKTQRD